MTAQPILLIPGLNCTGEVFAPLLAAAWRFGPVTIADHRRGASMAEIAAAILAEAPPRFAMLGFSMGGYIAFEILRQARKRVTRICLLDTMARPDNAQQAEDRRRKIAIAETGRFEAILSAQPDNAVHPDNAGNDAIKALRRRMALSLGPELYIAHQTAILTRPDSRPDLAAIGVPAHVIVGEADKVTEIEPAREIASGISGARLTVIAGAGHFAPVEQPEAVGQALAAWLQA